MANEIKWRSVVIPLMRFLTTQSVSNRKAPIVFFGFLVFCCFVAGAEPQIKGDLLPQTPFLDNHIIIVDPTQAVESLPAFFTNPPPVLQMGNFTLNVESWQSRSWDSQNQQIVTASGLAWFTFGCEPKLRPWFPGELLTNHVFVVVRTVQRPDQEISLADARKIDPLAQIGSKATLPIPTSALTASEISKAIGIIFGGPLLPAGSIQVQFSNLTITATANAGIGQVLSGNAFFPAATGDSTPIELPENNFSLYLNSLMLTPQGATVNGFLQMPPSIIDPGTGHPGQIAITNFEISDDCSFHVQLPALPYGPWAIGNTEVRVQGTGVVADFDTAWAAPSAPMGTPESDPSWEGVLLGSGTTVTPSGTAPGRIISNSGYVRGTYFFSGADVSQDGFDARLNLRSPFTFETLEPLGYLVQLRNGSIDITNSALSGGLFGPIVVAAPQNAVSYNLGTARVVVDIPTLVLASNLDFYGFAQMTNTTKDVSWGDSNQNPLDASNTWYRAGDFAEGCFGISGTNYSNYFPLDDQDEFTSPNSVSSDPLPSGFQGLTLFNPAYFDILTADTPNAAALQFIPTAVKDRDVAVGEFTWLNIVYDGVHGNFPKFISKPQTSLDLGPVQESYYLGVAPFKAGSDSVSNTPSYSLSVSFVASSVWSAAMSGTVALPEPTGTNLDFSQMGFTSTAEITGAQVPLNNPLTLDYWGVKVVKKPGQQAGAVMDVHTGQIFFTAAGIGESQHFAQPFYLLWGKMLANGTLGDLDFDDNCAGQEFDGFYYVPEYVALSDYVTTMQGWLKTAGNASFDFFGAKYLNINDTNTPNLAMAPYNGRDVALADDSDPQGAYQGTDHTLTGNWSQGLGNFNFTYNYDAAAQDGFTGTGTSQFLWITDPLAATVVLKADPEICICVSDTARHQMQLGPLADFATVGQVSGCGCVVNGQLQEIMLSASLESDANANVVVNSANYGSVQLTLTPAVSQVQVQGDMFLTVNAGAGAHIEVTGQATFAVNRAQDYVEGNVSGHFDSSTLLGLSSLTADGALDWHISAPVSAQSYQELQGNLTVNVVTPIGGSGVEGGFYLGINAPKSEAWVLSGADPHFNLNVAALPDTLTGIYGYAKVSESLNLWIVSGGYDAYAGLGGFFLPVASVGPLNAIAPGAGIGAPYIIGNVGFDVWGEILGGLVSADGWADLQVIAPYPFSFQGTVGLQACVLWVACGSANLSVGVNSSQGFFVN